MAGEYSRDFTSYFNQVKTKFNVVGGTDYSSKRIPTDVSSEFTINDLMGSWAERLVYRTIKDHADNIVPIMYGRSDQLIAGQEGFADLWKEHMTELDTIGKRPDVLIYKSEDAQSLFADMTNIAKEQSLWKNVNQAVAGLEVRSSKQNLTINEEYKDKKIGEHYESLKALIKVVVAGIKAENLQMDKIDVMLDWLEKIDKDDFPSTIPRKVTISRSIQDNDLINSYNQIFVHLKKISSILASYRSFTVKVEDLEITNKWVSKYNVPHYYIQVFDDRVYAISTLEIFKVILDDGLKNTHWKLEKNPKNQMKSTFYVNLDRGVLIGQLSKQAEIVPVKIYLDNGRVIYATDFKNGELELDYRKFTECIQYP
jgi:hypothetical protein